MMMTGMPAPEPWVFPEWHEITIRHSDLDPNDHVTNSVVCAWFDDGRYFLLRRELRPLVKSTDFFALAKIEMNFKKEIRFNDRPRVGTGITHIGCSSIAMLQYLMIGDQLAATATSVTVLADGNSRRAVSLSPRQREAMDGYLLLDIAL